MWGFRLARGRLRAAGPPALGGYDPTSPVATALLRKLKEALTGLLVIHPDIVVLTGLGLGVEQLAADDIRARVLWRLPTRRLPRMRLRITRRGK